MSTTIWIIIAVAVVGIIIYFVSKGSKDEEGGQTMPPSPAEPVEQTGPAEPAEPTQPTEQTGPTEPEEPREPTGGPMA
jgi:flagellar basal body-associated protein FliL